MNITEDDTDNTTLSSEVSNSNASVTMILSGPGFPWDNKWTHGATKTLLELYVKNEDKFKDPNTKKKQIWGEISEILRSNGYTFDAEKCERKFLNLKTVYRNNVQHNSMTGNHDRKCSFFDELEAIFHLSSKLRSSKKTDPKLPDVIEPKRSAQRNSSNETNGSPVVPVLLVPHNGKGMSEANKTLSSSFNPTQISNPHYPRANPTMAQSIDSVSHPNVTYSSIVQRNRQPSQQQRFSKSISNIPYQRSASTENVDRSQPVHHNSSTGTAIIDLCRETSDNLKRGSSEIEIRAEPPQMKKRRASDLQSLLESFENYRREQREREEHRMRQMKEMHEDEMKVTNRFLDIIHQYVQNGNS